MPFMAKDITINEALQKMGFKDFDDLIGVAMHANIFRKSVNDLLKQERDYLETLIDIEQKFGDNPKKFTEEVKAFITYWSDYCETSSEGDIINYKEEDDDDYFPCSSDPCEDYGPGGYSPVD